MREPSSAHQAGRKCGSPSAALKVEKMETHLLICWTLSRLATADAPVRVCIVWLCVPLFYRRDVKHRACQGPSASLKYFGCWCKWLRRQSFGFERKSGWVLASAAL
jgi:hypothetical protein